MLSLPLQRLPFNDIVLFVVCLFVCVFLCVADPEAQTAEVSEVIYDDVPSEEPLSPDEGQ